MSKIVLDMKHVFSQLGLNLFTKFRPDDELRREKCLQKVKARLAEGGENVNRTKRFPRGSRLAGAKGCLQIE